MDLGEEEEVVKGVEAMEVNDRSPQSVELVGLLRRFLGIQQRRAEAYGRLRRGFTEYMTNGGDLAYGKLCGEITTEFSDCSKQVIEMESRMVMPDLSRHDLASMLRSVQEKEKEKLQMTAKIQILKKSGRPSERLESCHHLQPNSRHHEHTHGCRVAESESNSETEATDPDSEYDAALKEAIQAVQDAVTCINEHLEEVLYEIDALETE